MNIKSFLLYQVRTFAPDFRSPALKRPDVTRSGPMAQISIIFNSYTHQSQVLIVS